MEYGVGRGMAAWSGGRASVMKWSGDCGGVSLRKPAAVMDLANFRTVTFFGVWGPRHMLSSLKDHCMMAVLSCPSAGSAFHPK